MVQAAKTHADDEDDGAVDVFGKITHVFFFVEGYEPATGAFDDGVVGGVFLDDGVAVVCNGLGVEGDVFFFSGDVWGHGEF